VVQRIILLDDNAIEPPDDVVEVVATFRGEIPTLEAYNNLPFILLQDGKSLAYYIECHINAETGIPLVDMDAVLDPEEQEQFRLQRELQPENMAFLRMCQDARENRQFSDIIAEYDSSYRPEIPLKILGGQHRVEATRRALDEEEVSRYHGFRVYFNLTSDQRNEIAQVANTNIAISTDLIDRMQETVRGPQLRNFCHKTGMLPTTEDFADRRSPEGKITVRLARTFLVNFLEGRSNRNVDPRSTIFSPYVCRSGVDDEKYLSLVSDVRIWADEDLLDAGERFARLHTKQMSIIGADPELNKSEFRNKAISMAVLSAWAYTAGLLQGKEEELQKLYSLPDNSSTNDPLSAKLMSEARHPNDPPTYRGLGTRYTSSDKGRMVELFLQYALSNTRKVTKALIDAAIAQYEAKVAVRRATRAVGRLP
jgi:hypothetical protein